MSDLFKIHCSSRTKADAASSSSKFQMPDERVMLVRDPKVGESLVIVAEEVGLVYTSPVRGFLQTPRGWVVETANHLYTLTAMDVGKPTLADAA
jgi:hypothetical protein